VDSGAVFAGFENGRSAPFGYKKYCTSWYGVHSFEILLFAILINNLTECQKPNSSSS
jgi:hypothetical protein